MNAVLLIARREFFAYLRSPLGSAIIAACLLIDGILFYFRALTPKLLSAEVLQEFIYSASGTTMIAGLVLSIALMGLAASFIARLLQRHRWIAYVGLAVILYVALEMIYRGWLEVAPLVAT